MKQNRITLLCAVIIFFCAPSLFASGIELRGEMSGYVMRTDYWTAGLRYIPQILLSRNMKNGNVIGGEFSLNLNGRIEQQDKACTGTLKPYRLTARYSATQYELRLGLQKINFGPAKILRPLMWFDAIDYRDPAQLTDGVPGFLARYYFLNNSNIWFWTLYGNSSLKGNEMFKTEAHTPEFGGRIQYPVPRGEVGLSFNTRDVSKEDWTAKTFLSSVPGREYRFGLDGDWDIGPGLWFEEVYSSFGLGDNKRFWRNMLTLGTDYTFSGGVHLLAEHLTQTSTADLGLPRFEANLTAMSADYNITILDRCMAAAYFNWQDEKMYYYVSWMRTYDNWRINASLFSAGAGNGSLKGKGGRVEVLYNY